MDTATLSFDQKTALDRLIFWYKNSERKNFITLGGFAGTGKTTLISIFRKQLYELNPDLKIAFVAYTGKAARVLKQKLLENGAIYKNDSISTIHSLIYSPVLNDREEIVGWEKKDTIAKNLLIIDEASMVDGLIWQHLLQYKVLMVAVGDHGQLPPIKEDFNLMSDPDLVLTEIHRQASKNPIIGLSIQARNHGHIRFANYGDGVIKYNLEDSESYDLMDDLTGNYSSDTLFLCGLNHTRKKLNNIIRQKKGFESEMPVVGDRVICLRNNHKKQIFNGMLGTVNQIFDVTERYIEIEIAMDYEDKKYRGRVLTSQFKNNNSANYTADRSITNGIDLFDFGYALTVHKAQGSQARKVILFEERFSKMTDTQWARWLYTGVTRAEEELIIFGR